MKPLRLYQIPFSHFCDKVRWALDYYSIPYEKINYVPGKTQLKNAPQTLQKLTPIIEDTNKTSYFISDSTPILIYLDENYRKTNKTLFPEEKSKDEIIKYCLKLDSQLGIYIRRLAYLHVINEKSELLSVFLDGKFDRKHFKNLKSYVFGLMGSCFLIGRFQLNLIDEENIFNKTVSILNEIQNDLQGKDFLFLNQFTAADLTLSSLIKPLKYIQPLFNIYKPLFDHCNRIKQIYDTNANQLSNIEQLLDIHQQQNKTKPIWKKWIFSGFQILFSPLEWILNFKRKKQSLLQYPSMNIQEKAHNDHRFMNLKSFTSFLTFFIRNIYHFYFSIPKQVKIIENQAKIISNQH